MGGAGFNLDSPTLALLGCNRGLDVAAQVEFERKGLKPGFHSID
jgi:hypothetical protein